MSRSRRSPVNRRIRFLLAILCIAFAALLGRAAWLQGVRASSLSRLAARQSTETVVLPASRGTIFDRVGVQLAIGEQATTVYADPQQVRDARLVAQAAQQTLGVNASQLYSQLLDKTKSFVYVERKADPQAAARLLAKKLAGIGSYPEERRVYPQSTVAAHVLGFAGVDNNGLAGLELELDKTLAGKPGSETVVKDALDHPINIQNERAARDGRDVFLTIDHAIQANAESVLKATIAKWHAKSATAIVLDPQTGAVLAMAVAPGFSSNAFGATPASVTRNIAVTDVYEPGSTFKLVTVAGVLSDHDVTPQTTFTLPYSIRVADRVIHDAEQRGTQRMSVARILAQSSNVGAITLAEKFLGKDRLSSWIGRFGFGRATGVGFPGESDGFVLPPDKWSGSTIGNVPIGQGIAVTPIQMATAYATVANGGWLVQPHLVDRIAGSAPVEVKRHRILAPAIAREVNAMLQNVVLDGTGTLAAVPGYKVAGKTGTAQIPDAHGYSTSKYVASFVGMVPASKPRLVILVKVTEPQGQIFGGVVAAPAFAQIAGYDLQYLEVPPDGVTPHG
ncbi:MAG: peptidoglycan D,D-transpeptidase FtsI family protein [Gaiellaceae bacterium]